MIKYLIYNRETLYRDCRLWTAFAFYDRYLNLIALFLISLRRLGRKVYNFVIKKFTFCSFKYTLRLPHNFEFSSNVMSPEIYPVS